MPSNDHSSNEENIHPSTAQTPIDSRSRPRQNAGNQFLASPGVKFIIIGVIITALLVPAILVWGLVEERADRAKEVAREIAQGWGEAQTLNGPYLIVPYIISVKSGVTYKSETRHAIISAQTLDIMGNLDVQERKKSIYKTQLYHLKSKLTGKFDPVDLSNVEKLGGKPVWDAAHIVLGVSDMTGFRSDLEVSINGKSTRAFEPGLGGLTRTYGKRQNLGLGVQLQIPEEELRNGFDFSLNLDLNGSRSLSIMPAGKTTKVSLDSNWPHPGFGGRFLPENRNISENGFDATWTIPYLARGMESVFLSDRLPYASSVISVSFVEPLKFYLKTARTLKYSIGFFSLVFLAVFVMEVTGKQPIHWIQYILVGLAMIVFYILLLALAEQVGFALAYLGGALATTILIAWYIGNAFGQRNSSWVTGGVLGTTYLLMYLIINGEDYALLAGALIAFAAIAATMIATRKVEWRGAA